MCRDNITVFEYISVSLLNNPWTKHDYLIHLAGDEWRDTRTFAKYVHSEIIYSLSCLLRSRSILKQRFRFIYIYIYPYIWTICDLKQSSSLCLLNGRKMDNFHRFAFKRERIVKRIEKTYSKKERRRRLLPHVRDSFNHSI